MGCCKRRSTTRCLRMLHPHRVPPHLPPSNWCKWIPQTTKINPSNPIRPRRKIRSRIRLQIRNRISSRLFNTKQTSLWTRLSRRMSLGILYQCRPSETTIIYPWRCDTKDQLPHETKSFLQIVVFSRVIGARVVVGASTVCGRWEWLLWCWRESRPEKVVSRTREKCRCVAGTCLDSISLIAVL